MGNNAKRSKEVTKYLHSDFLKISQNFSKNLKKSQKNSGQYIYNKGTGPKIFSKFLKIAQNFSKSLKKSQRLLLDANEMGQLRCQILPNCDIIELSCPKKNANLQLHVSYQMLLL